MPEWDEFVSCPYDVQHRVLRSHLRRHILKCEQTHPPLAVCFYNGTHRVPLEQLVAHMRECPSRRDVQAPPELRRAARAPPAHPPPALRHRAPAPRHRAPAPDLETWD